MHRAYYMKKVRMININLKKITYEKRDLGKNKQEYWKFGSDYVAKIPKVEDQGMVIIERCIKN